MSSDRIRGRPPATPELPRAAEEKPAEAPKAAPGGPEAARGAPLDKFERNVKVGPQLESRLQALAGRATGSKIVFSNEDVAALAGTFATILTHNRGATRGERARLFARAILRRKRLRKVFGGVPEQQMEQMCDAIGDLLDSSPIFGQLVDNVSEGAGKLSSG